jgi:putative glutamine amidotransferase
VHQAAAGTPFLRLFFIVRRIELNENTRPLIGVPCRFNWENQYYELRETYAEVIYACGGAPLMVPLIPESDYIDSVMEQFDAICLSGAINDVSPLRYGQEPRPGLGPVLPRRDETDMLLLSSAEARQVPVLAICFGIQSLNVYRGGTLIQDIASEVKGALKHMQGDVFWRHSHSINITEGSLLAGLAGGTSSTVNSHHHQAIDVVGHDLEPIAWASDGVVEAVINKRTDQFVMGVQWHPEVAWQNDRLSQAIFGHFISVARERREALRLVGSRA